MVEGSNEAASHWSGKSFTTAEAGDEIVSLLKNSDALHLALRLEDIVLLKNGAPPALFTVQCRHDRDYHFNRSPVESRAPALIKMRTFGRYRKLRGQFSSLRTCSKNDGQLNPVGDTKMSNAYPVTQVQANDLL